MKIAACIYYLLSIVCYCNFVTYDSTGMPNCWWWFIFNSGYRILIFAFLFDYFKDYRLKGISFVNIFAQFIALFQVIMLSINFNCALRHNVLYFKDYKLGIVLSFVILIFLFLTLFLYREWKKYRHL